MTWMKSSNTICRAGPGACERCFWSDTTSRSAQPANARYAGAYRRLNPTISETPLASATSSCALARSRASGLSTSTGTPARRSVATTSGCDADVVCTNAASRPASMASSREPYLSATRYVSPTEARLDAVRETRTGVTPGSDVTTGRYALRAMDPSPTTATRIIPTRSSPVVAPIRISVGRSACRSRGLHECFHRSASAARAFTTDRCVAVSSECLHVQQRTQMSRGGPVDDREQGHSLVVVLPTRVFAESCGADDICGRDACMDAQGHIRVSDVRGVIGELVDHHGGVGELSAFASRPRRTLSSALTMRGVTSAPSLPRAAARWAHR